MMTILLINTAMAWEIQTTGGGAEYHWPDMPLDYVWVEDGAPELPRLQRAIDEAFDTWTNVPGADISVWAAPAAGAVGEVALDDHHVVFFENDWPIGSGALAIATTWADEDGRVVSFDIRVNGGSPWSTSGDGDRFDLQAAITHEVGHVLGLEHSAVDEATMFASHDLGEMWRQELHEDDQAAVQYLYDADGLASDRSTAGCAVLGSGPTAPGLVWLGLAPLTLLLRRRSH